MLGTSLGETLTLDALPAISMDTEQREWSLRNIVDLSLDGLTNSRAMIGKVVPGLAVTISFQEEHILRWARCNSYEASLRIDGGNCHWPSISHGVIVRAPEGCPWAGISLLCHLAPSDLGRNIRREAFHVYRN